MATFGVLTLTQAVLQSNYLRGVDDRAVSALIYTLAPLAGVWLLHYRQPWQFRTSAAGLDFRARRTDQAVHVPWSAVTSVRLHRRRLELTIDAANAGAAFDDRWKQESLGDPRPEGQLLVTAHVGALRPSIFRLGVELARHLPPDTPVQ